jgi:predicted nucleic acid-binding protein
MLLSFEHVALVSPEEKINAIQDDPQDNIFLECAVAGRCELIVSGDRHLLQLKSYKDIKIMTAVEFALALEARP